MSGATLRRQLTLPLVTFYGLGTILGAGIYVLVAAVAARAGPAMPFAFLIAAVIAGFTAFSYAELSSRYPRAAAEAVYVTHAFGQRWLAIAVGYALVLVGIVSAATLTRGFVGYFAVFLGVPDAAAMTGLALLLGAVAAVGILASARLVTLVTLIEIGGLLLVVGAAWTLEPAAAPATSPVATLPAGGIAGALAGAFLAFYAFLGFEDMVNVAEEVRSPARTMPRAILLALAISTVLYLLVTQAVLSALPAARLAESEAPMADVIAALGVDPRVLAAISLVAVVNGALVQIIKASRVLYGLAREGIAPAPFARVSPVTRTPLFATLIATALVLAFALALPLVGLAALTSGVTLAIFVLVNAALVRLKHRGVEVAGAASYPVWVPVTGAALSLALLAFAVVAG